MRLFAERLVYQHRSLNIWASLYFWTLLSFESINIWHIFGIIALCSVRIIAILFRHIRWKDQGVYHLTHQLPLLKLNSPHRVPHSDCRSSHIYLSMTSIYVRTTITQNLLLWVVEYSTLQTSGICHTDLFLRSVGPAYIIWYFDFVNHEGA